MFTICSQLRGNEESHCMGGENQTRNAFETGIYHMFNSPFSLYQIFSYSLAVVNYKYKSDDAI